MTHKVTSWNFLRIFAEIYMKLSFAKLSSDFMYAFSLSREKSAKKTFQGVPIVKYSTRTGFQVLRL